VCKTLVYLAKDNYTQNMLTTNGQIQAQNSITVIVTAEGNEVAVTRVYNDKITKENIEALSDNIEEVIYQTLFKKRVKKTPNENNAGQEGE